MLEGLRVRYARDDLRRKTKVVLEEADKGYYVQISSRVLNQGDLHILNDERLASLISAQDELAKKKKFEASSVRARLGERLRDALAILENTGNSKRALVTPEGISKTLMLQSPYSFDDVLKGKKKPTFRLLRRFSWHYGFNNFWVQTGEGPKFAQYEGKSEPGHLIGTAGRAGYKHFHFILFEGAPHWPIRLLIGDGAYNWQSASGNWFLDHEALGGSGRQDQIKFYRLLKTLRENGQEFEVTSSRVIGEENYTRFYREQEHPAWFFAKRNYDDWADTFMDACEGKAVFFRDPPKDSFEKLCQTTADFISQNTTTAPQSASRSPMKNSSDSLELMI